MIKGVQIGNYFKHGERIVCVSAIFKTHFNCESLEGISIGNSLQEKFTPIPIAATILESCGFIGFVTNSEMTLEVFNNLESESMNITCPDKKSNEIRLFLEISQRGENWENNYVSILLRANYLHQLQNLYFDLTGNEIVVLKQDK